MITTVTVNPCIDKTLSVEAFDIYKMNRATVISNDVSGKGVNVSLALHNIGVDTCAIGFNFYSGNNNIMERELLEKGIKNDFVKVDKPLRTCTKVFVKDINHTIEINENGAEVSRLDGEKVIEKIKECAKKSFAITLSGSLPKGLDYDFYYKCVKAIKEVSPNTFVVVDSEKKSLLKALEAKPNFIKPNIFEFQDTFNVEVGDELDLKNKALKVLKDYGLSLICVSMGKKGALITNGKETFIGKIIDVKVKSIQGAGDATVAGILTALENGKSLKDCLRYGIALSSGKVMFDGTTFCNKEVFDNLLKEDINITEL